LVGATVVKLVVWELRTWCDTTKRVVIHSCFQLATILQENILPHKTKNSGSPHHFERQQESGVDRKSLLCVLYHSYLTPRHKSNIPTWKARAKMLLAAGTSPASHFDLAPMSQSTSALGQ